MTLEISFNNKFGVDLCSNDQCFDTYFQSWSSGGLARSHYNHHLTMNFEWMFE